MKIQKNINDNIEYIKSIFSYGESSDVIIKNLSLNVGLGRKYECFLVFIEGTVNTDQIDRFIIEAMHIVPRNAFVGDLADLVQKQLITRDQLTRVTTYEEVVKSVNYGGCGIFIDTLDLAFTADVKGWNYRSINTPENETVIRGPQAAFNEVLRINTGLVRKIVRNENLICKNFDIGTVTTTGVNLLYIKNIADYKLIKEVERRLNKIDIDHITDSGELEQLLEDFSFLPTPQILSTQRPDRVASALAKGKVAILADGSPFALILPIDVFELMYSMEDNYLRTPFGNLIRVMRIIAMISALLLPGIFVAIVNFHHESIPERLLFAIAESRASVPFSLLTELIILEFSFEFIREASIRMPGTGGSAIGIIGGLIVGQAAVEANIVSPISIIIVALTGIGSFVIPNYSLGLSFRIVKYFYLLLGATAGFLGITSGMFLQLLWLTSAQSFGMPFFEPKNHNVVSTLFIKPLSMFSRIWAKGKDKTVYQPDDTVIIE